MNPAPLSWIKQVESSLFQTGDVPMWGTFPGFPWKTFEKEFAAAFGIKKLSLKAGTIEWKKGDAVLKGMGRSPLGIGIELTPLNGSVSLIFPTEDFSKLSSWAMHQTSDKKGFSASLLQKGFFRYMTLEAFHIIDKLQAFPGLTPTFIDMPQAEEDAYCIDFSFEHEGHTASGRLICPSLFQEAFKKHFVGDWSLSTPSPLYETIDVRLNLTAGRTSISQDAWKSVNKGDLVFLDYCSYSPNLKRGTFQLGVNGNALFQAKLKDDKIKILDYALYTQETAMDEEDRIEDDHILEESQEPIPVDEAPSEKMVSPKQVPLSLSVEVAGLTMNLDKLLKLKPGNVLELNVSPEQGVNLIANGKKMAEGDLVQIGDVLGVKITKIGK